MTMKIGCCVDLRDHELLLACKDAGVDYIEGSLSVLYTMSQKEIQSLVHLLRDNNLSIECFNGMFPGDIRLTGEWVDYSKVNSYLFEVLEKAALFCPSIIVFGSGGARNLPEGFSKEYGTEQLAFLLSRYVAPLFSKYGITCAIEPLCTAECNIINTVEEGAALAQAVSDDHICLLADIYHMMQNGETADSILQLKDKPVHLHIASKDRVLPHLNDGTDYKPFFDALKKIGYDGRISLECRIDPPHEQNIRTSLEYLRSLAK